MTNYPRDPEWYIESQAIYAKPLEFNPAPVSFIEIWNYSTGDSQVLEGTLEPSEIKAWLSKEAHRLVKDREQLEPINGIRLLIESKEDENDWRRTFPWNKEDLLAITSEFRLPSSFLQPTQRLRSCYSVLSRQELAGRGSELDLGFILRPPQDSDINLNLVFSWNATTRTTGGIIRTIRQNVLDTFLRELKSLRHLASQPLVLGLAALESILLMIPKKLNIICADIVMVQSRTGHLGSIHLNSVPNPQKVLDYEKVSLEVSKISQGITWYRVIWKSYLHLCEFMAQLATRLERLENRGIPGCPTSSPASVKHLEVFSELLSANKSRLVHQLDELDNYKELCAIQNQNVYNLIAQRDVQQNIELARDPKSIAVASKRDSSAMKSIALLTMVVLPGTFISTLFAIFLFNWDAESWRDVPKPRFWFYWALTVPLTIFSVVAWLAWQKIYERTGRNLDQAAREAVSKFTVSDNQIHEMLSSSDKPNEMDNHDISDGLRIRKRDMFHRRLPWNKQPTQKTEACQGESLV